MLGAECGKTGTTAQYLQRSYYTQHYLVDWRGSLIAPFPYGRRYGRDLHPSGPKAGPPGTPGPAMKLVGPLAGGSPGLRLELLLGLALEIERHCSADEILQGRLIDLVAFVDVDGAPDIPVEAGVE